MILSEDTGELPLFPSPRDREPGQCSRAEPGAFVNQTRRESEA